MFCMSSVEWVNEVVKLSFGQLPIIKPKAANRWKYRTVTASKTTTQLNAQIKADQWTRDLISKKHIILDLTHHSLRDVIVWNILTTI